MRRIRIYSYTKRDERRDPAIHTMTKKLEERGENLPTGEREQIMEKGGCNLLELRKGLCTIETNGSGQKRGTVESMKSPQN